MVRSRVLPMVLVLVALGGAACSGGSDSDSTSRAGSSAGSSTTSTRAAPDAAVVLPAVAPKAKTVDGTLRTPDGRDRRYHVYVPSTVPAGAAGPPVPLLVAMHGGAGWGTQFERNSGFDGLAEANRFIVVYPDGVGVGPDAAYKTWNSGSCCGIAAREDVDDVTFIRMLIERLRDEHPIDAARTYAAGHSNGGMEAYRLACELSDRVVAVGVQSSALVTDDCRPTRPVSLLHIHGTADQNLPIDGGIGPKTISGVSYPPPRDGVETIASLDRCPAQPVQSRDPANADVTVETWKPCADATEVEMVTVAGATHAWMGGEPMMARPGTNPYPDLDSSAVIWAFLIAHPRHD